MNKKEKGEVNRDGEGGSFQAEHLANTFFGESIYTRPFEWNEPGGKKNESQP